MKKISDLKIGDLFSLSKNGAVHMVDRIANHLEYKSYADGKIRVYHNIERLVYLKPQWDRMHELKWFCP